MREINWPVEGVYEGIVLSDGEHFREIEVDEENELYMVQFDIRVTKCRDREDGKIALENGDVVDSTDIRVSLPSSGENAWRLQEFLRVLGYRVGRSAEEEVYDSDEWHGKRVVFRVVRGVSKRTGKEYTSVRFIGRVRETTTV